MSDRYKCGHCGYEGYCYGSPMSVGVSAPWCTKCQMNNKLTKINANITDLDPEFSKAINDNLFDLI